MKKTSIFSLTSIMIFFILMEPVLGRKSEKTKTSGDKIKVVNGVNENKPVRKPDEKTWRTWVGELKAYYREKLSPPSATSHVYLKKEGDVVWIDEAHSYPRWISEKCKNCRYQVKRVREKKLLLVDHQTKKSIKMVSDRENQVPERQTLFIRVFELPDDEIRLFLHDLSLKDLQKKRERHFYEYNGKEVWPGRFYWLKKPKSVTFQRSDGSKKETSVVAEVRYNKGKLNGHLSVYGFGDEKWYREQTEAMLLFRDYSNGKKTYGSGRFLSTLR